MTTTQSVKTQARHLEAVANLLHARNVQDAAWQTFNHAEKRAEHTYYNAPQPEHAKAVAAKDAAWQAIMAAAKAYGETIWFAARDLGLSHDAISARVEELDAGAPATMQLSF